MEAEMKFKPGDLVETEIVNETGWGEQKEQQLVLVLKICERPGGPPIGKHFPLSAYLDETSHEEDVLYEVLRGDGTQARLGLIDYNWTGAKMTNRLVQSIKNKTSE